MRNKRWMRNIAFEMIAVILISEITNVQASGLEYNEGLNQFKEAYVYDDLQIDLEGLSGIKTLEEIYIGETDVIQEVTESIHPNIIVKSSKLQSLQILVSNINNYSFNEDSIYYSLIDDDGITYKMNFDGKEKKKIGNGIISYGKVTTNSPYIVYTDRTDAYAYDLEAKKNIHLGQYLYGIQAGFLGEHIMIAAMPSGIPIGKGDPGMKQGYHIVNDDFTCTRLPKVDNIIVGCSKNYVYFSPGDSSELWVCKIDGSNAKKVSSMLMTSTVTYKDKVYLLRRDTEKTGNVSGIYTMNLDGSNFKTVIEFKDKKTIINAKQYVYEGIGIDGNSGICIIGDYIYFSGNSKNYIVATGKIDDDWKQGQGCGDSVYRIKMDGTGLEKILAQKTETNGNGYDILGVRTNGTDLFFVIDYLKVGTSTRNYSLYKLKVNK